MRTRNFLLLLMAGVCFAFTANAQVKDIDGNSYPTVKIGKQTWMAANLRVTKLNDGTPIENVQGGEAWGNLSTPAYAWYENDDEKQKETYGVLYNWYAVETGKLCPAGWHVPNNEEWDKLAEFVDKKMGKYNKTEQEWENIGGHLKSKTDWKNEGQGTDDFGFNALPAGNVTHGGGYFGDRGLGVHFWSSNEGVNNKSAAFNKFLYYDSQNLKNLLNYKVTGFSVRCLQD
jgi:uncharacterized protein (TIGR02145 family)